MKLVNIKNIRYDIINIVIVWQLAKTRLIIANTNNTSLVRGSTKKIYKQKGLGKARHGSMRVNHFRGGGVTFGPSIKRRFLFNVNKTIKKIAFTHVVLLKFYTNSIRIIDSINNKSFKTKYHKYIIKEYKKILFVDLKFHRNFVLSTNNIRSIKLLKINGINTLDLIKSDIVYISKQSFSLILQMLR